MRHFVVGTAGHIDHGKTSLVRALTGVDTDRLVEEKRRGITIELGFAPWQLAPDCVASIVDVPGHERLVRTMVAGATGMDAVMLVIAADDGVMPQTREHLDVLALLGLQRGVIVLSKCDLAGDAELLDLIEEDIRAQTRATFLEGAPIVRVSCKTGTGLVELRAAVARLAEGCADRPRMGPAILPLDRAFNIAGHGRVGTGTLLRGALRLEDTVEVFGDARGSVAELRVRGLQSLGIDASEVVAGMRTAVNLAGRGAETVERGMTVATSGAFVGCDALLVAVAVLPGALTPLRDERVTLHLGTCERSARVIPLGAEGIAPGEHGAALLRLEAAVPAFSGQRFVLRRPGVHGQATVAGGDVLDPEPPRGKRSVSQAAQVATELSVRDPATSLLALARESRASGIRRVELERRLVPGAGTEALSRLLEQGALVPAQGDHDLWLSAAFCDERVTTIIAAVRAYEAAHPLEPGLSESEVSGALDPPERSFAATFVARAIALGRLVGSNGVLASPGRTAIIDTETRDLAERMTALYVAARLTPPSDAEVATQFALTPTRCRELLSLLRRQRAIEKVGDEFHAHVGALRGLEETIAAALSDSRTITAAEFKDIAGGISRKFAIPLLEFLDRQRVTLRQGNVRRLHPARIVAGVRASG